MIPDFYYLSNPPLTFSNRIGPTTYPLPNMVFIEIVTTRGGQGVQVSVMTPLVTTPIGGFSTGNPLPYFQLPAQNPPSKFSNFGGRIPMGGNGSPPHGNGRPLGGGNGPLGGGGGPLSGGRPLGGGGPPSDGGKFPVGGGANVPFSAPWLGSPITHGTHHGIHH
jgi:hypothetical protein